MDRFPHINDAPFPGVPDDAFQAEPAFDWSVWTPAQRVHLCTVAWRRDYADVVDWESVEARDAWFDSLEDVSVNPTTVSRRASNRVRVPIPYADALAYPYLWTEFSPMPVPGSASKRRLFYFIIGAEYLAPNTTELILEPDLWTTYRLDVSIDEAFLVRGHAPMDAMDAEEFLSDPRANLERLGAPEADYTDGADVVASSDDRPLGAGEKSVVFASHVPPEAIPAVFAAPGSRTSGSPVFSDDYAYRYGYQIDVSGISLGASGSYDWSSQRAASAPFSASVDGNVPGSWLYAMPASDLFLKDGSSILSRYPGIASIAEAFFIIPSGIVEARFLLRVEGVPLYVVEGTRAETVSHRISVDDFAFGPDAPAKLYTWPYAWYSLDASDGQSVPIRIESCSSTIELEQLVTLAWPILKWSVSAVNVGGSGWTESTWTRLDGSTVGSRVPLAPWERTMVSLGIPTYELRIDGGLLASWRSSAERAAREQRMATSYRNSMRSTNTSRENTVDSNATMVSNTANSGNTATANTATSNAANKAMSDQATISSLISTEGANVEDGLQVAADNALNSALTSAQNDAASISNAAGTNASIGGSLLTGALVGAGLGGGLPGAIAGAAASALMPSLNAWAADTGTAVAANLSSAQAGAINTRNTDRADAKHRQARLNTQYQSDLRDFNTTTSNTAATTITAANVALANTNAGNTRTTSNANATYSQHVAAENAQDDLRAAIAEYNAGLDDRSRTAPVAVTPATGDPIPDALARKGIRIRAHQASSRAIKRMTDELLVHGYRYGALWTFSDRLADRGKAFSYVQLDRVVRWSGTIQDTMRSAVFDILRTGTTLWTDPASVGKEAPHDR